MAIATSAFRSQAVPVQLRQLWAANLRQARERSRFRSQAELAAYIGCTRAAVSNWERGIHAPTYQSRVALAAALHRNPATLFPE